MKIAEIITPRMMNKAEKPLLRTTPTHYDQALGNKSQVIVLMSPWDFLKLGTGSLNDMEDIRDKSQKLSQYNNYAKSGENILMPFLRISISPNRPEGKVIGHEGRHRAAAVIAAKGKWMRVAIMLRPEDGYESEISRQQVATYGHHVSNIEYTLTAADLPRFVRDQFTGLYLIPTSNWKIEEPDYLRRYRRDVEETRKLSGPQVAGSGKDFRQNPGVNHSNGKMPGKVAGTGKALKAKSGFVG